MTPKLKAKELVDKFYYCDKIQAKQCALIAVDEILNILDYPCEQYSYYLEVKNEIEKNETTLFLHRK